MAEYNATSRESKKRRLKENIVRTQDDTTARRKADDSEDGKEEVLRKSVKKSRRRKRTIILIMVLAVAGGILAWFQYQKFHRYTSYSVVWEKPMEQGSLVGYAMFGENVLKYTHDGAAYYDDKGKMVWNEPFEMKSPIVAQNGNFIAIADQGGNSIYICDVSGCQGKAQTLLPITRIGISGHGVVAAVLEDSTAGYISYYARDGRTIKNSIKSILSSDGYPMDIALSQDGTQLLCAYVYLKDGGAKSRAVFYDFDKGKSETTRMVGVFAEDYFAGSMLGRVKFLKEPYSCAVANNSLTFFTTKNLTSPDVVTQVNLEEQIQSVFFSREYVGLIVRPKEGSHEYRMDVYEANGEKVFSREFTFDYKHVDIDGDKVFLYNETSCSIFNLAGVEIFRGDFDFAISGIRSGKFPGIYLVTGPDAMKEIKLR